MRSEYGKGTLFSFSMLDWDPQLSNEAWSAFREKQLDEQEEEQDVLVPEESNGLREFSSRLIIHER